MNRRLAESRVSRSGERGGARLKFFVVILIVGIVAYSGYLYLSVQFDAYRLKDLMQHDVDVASTQGYPVTWVSDQLKKNAADYNVPADAIITPSRQDNRTIVRVQ